MKIVVDLGCVPRNGANSLSTLAMEYSPDHIYGFDPGLPRNRKTTAKSIPVTLKRSAAWLHDGWVTFHEDGSASRIGEYGAYVPCFDFSVWLMDLLTEHGEPARIFVKMDIEGAEVQLLERMISDGTDRLVSELLVEWHGAKVDGLSCPVREWWM